MLNRFINTDIKEIRILSRDEKKQRRLIRNKESLSILNECLFKMINKNLSSNLLVVAISIGSYPFGMATSGRHINLLSGLAELGFDVMLYSLYPDKNQDPKSNKVEGIYNNIKFQYTTPSLHFNTNKFKRIILDIFSILRCLYKIYKVGQNRKIYVINFITNPIITFFCTIFLKLFMLRVIHESTEFPLTHTIRKKITNFIYYKLTLPLFDRVYVISTALKNNYSNYISNSKIGLINIVVQPKNFDEKTQPPFDFEYIAYCGMMNSDKDGVTILIEAFSKIVEEYPELKLVLIGDIVKRPINPDIKIILNEKSLGNKVIFTGHINNKKLPAYLKGAKLLALARPDNIQAKGGFPTKLGEYLAAGRPIVVTDVGDIPLFIKDNINGFISKPDADEFAKKIIYVFENYTHSLNVAKRGRQLAEEEFNYLTESKKIASFITSK